MVILYPKIFINISRSLVFIILLIKSESSISQQDSLFVRKIPVSGSIVASLGSVEYFNTEKNEIKEDFNLTTALNIGFYLGNFYNVSVMFSYPFNREVLKYSPWISDYNFIISRNKYIPNSFFWGYSNYANNKYNNSLELIGESFLAGNFFVGYFFKIPNSFHKILKEHPTSVLSPSVVMNYAIKYFNQNGEFKGGLVNGKPVLVLNLKYIILYNISVYCSLLNYLNSSTKLQWDSDYTYGFGFENWKPWKISFYYSKYINKYPWSEFNTNSGFFHGLFSISLNYIINIKH